MFHFCISRAPASTGDDQSRTEKERQYGSQVIVRRKGRYRAGETAPGNRANIVFRAGTGAVIRNALLRRRLILRAGRARYAFAFRRRICIDVTYGRLRETIAVCIRLAMNARIGGSFASWVFRAALLVIEAFDANSAASSVTDGRRRVDVRAILGFLTGAWNTFIAEFPLLDDMVVRNRCAVRGCRKPNPCLRRLVIHFDAEPIGGVEGIRIGGKRQHRHWILIQLPYQRHFGFLLCWRHVEPHVLIAHTGVIDPHEHALFGQAGKTATFRENERRVFFVFTIQHETNMVSRGIGVQRVAHGWNVFSGVELNRETGRDSGVPQARAAGTGLSNVVILHQKRQTCAPVVARIGPDREAEVNMERPIRRALHVTEIDGIAKIHIRRLALCQFGIRELQLTVGRNFRRPIELQHAAVRHGVGIGESARRAIGAAIRLRHGAILGKRRVCPENQRGGNYEANGLMNRRFHVISPESFFVLIR